MEITQSAMDEVMKPSCESVQQSEGRRPMDVYMIDLDTYTATEAQANRDLVTFDPYGRWLLDTGGGRACARGMAQALAVACGRATKQTSTNSLDQRCRALRFTRG